VAAFLHAAAFCVLLVMTVRALSGAAAWGLLAAIGALLVIEHRQVHRVDLAFFRINAVLGFVIFALIWAGLPAG
jgi:hypothetical protein